MEYPIPRPALLQAISKLEPQPNLRMIRVRKPKRAWQPRTTQDIVQDTTIHGGKGLADLCDQNANIRVNSVRETPRHPRQEVEYQASTELRPPPTRNSDFGTKTQTNTQVVAAERMSKADAQWWVQGSGFRVHGSGVGVQGFGVGVAPGARRSAIIVGFI